MTETKIDLSKYENHLGRKHQLIRLLWGITWALCASWLPRSVAKGWKNFLLRIFGAKIAKTAHVYSSAKVYYPPFLTMGEYSCLASDVDAIMLLQYLLELILRCLKVRIFILLVMI